MQKSNYIRIFEETTIIDFDYKYLQVMNYDVGCNAKVVIKSHIKNLTINSCFKLTLIVEGYVENLIMKHSYYVICCGNIGKTEEKSDHNILQIKNQIIYTKIPICKLEYYNLQYLVKVHSTIKDLKKIWHTKNIKTLFLTIEKNTSVNFDGFENLENLTIICKDFDKSIDFSKFKKFKTLNVIRNV